MNRIQEVFENKETFIPFITTGDPDLSVTEELMPTMAEVGVDLVEIGIPSSNPVAEEIVIQEADVRALASNTTMDRIFGSVKHIRLKTDVSLAFMTCINPVFARGVDKFTGQAADCGIDILIVPDIPFEERQELLSARRQHGLILIYLVAPTSRGRAQTIAREPEGFVYCISPLDVAGVRKEITTNIKEMVEAIKQGKNVSCVIGFSTPILGQATKMVARSDDVIVGSAIVKIVAEYGTLCMKPAYDCVYEMKQAVGVWEIIKRKRSVSGEQSPVTDLP